MQYVDQKGCLYLRAGFGAETVWVPMVNDQHQPICGMPPTGGGAAPVTAATPAPPAPEPKPVPPTATASAPAATAPAPATVAASTPAPAAGPAPEPQIVVVNPAPAAPPTIEVVSRPPPPVPVGRGYQSVAIGGTSASCANSAPVLEKVVLRGGGHALVCTRGDGTLNGWQPPAFPPGAPVGAALGFTTPTPSNMRGARPVGPLTPPTAALAANDIPTPPKGWKLAWTDGRLNPMRGVGTAQGQAMQDRVWTRTVPAQPVVPAAMPGTVAAQATYTADDTTVARVSTMSAPAAVHLYVQIGTYGVPSNAEAADARVTAMGLPAASRQSTSGGRLLQVVYAGPFASRAEAVAARSQLVAAGYRDAFIR